MLHEDIWPAVKGTQIKRAAITLHFLLNEWKLLYKYEVYVFVTLNIYFSLMIRY